MLDLVFQNYTSTKAPTEQFFIKIFEVATEALNLKNKVELSVNLVGDNKIRALNKRHRNKNKVTDVLSFPLEEKKLEKYGILPLGDIFICLPFAKKEAKSENVSIDRKLAQLAVHGFLHLLGYDHERSGKDADEMFRLENKILDKLT